MKTIFALALLSVSAFASEKQVDVIYGEDDRMDVYESQDQLLKEISRSTAAMISPAFLKAQGSTVLVNGKSFKDRGLCEEERFRDQVAVANCSGFLVAPNVLVTAGHCIKSEEQCASHRWVFDYKMSAKGGAISVPASNVYECEKILSREWNMISKQDFAVIELKKKVTDRKPLSFRRSGSVSVGDSVAAIGHPSGLPTKITDGGVVRRLSGVFFITNLDTYQGNSGSAVVNTKTGEVEGILVRGDTDFIRGPQGCQVSKRCESDDCRGEDVTSITGIEYLRKL